MPQAVDELIQGSIKQNISSSIISQLALQLHQRTLSEVDICHYRDKLSLNLLKEASHLPYGTPVEMLIAEFQLKKDVSFCYVLHDMNSGFVTYKKLQTMMYQFQMVQIMMSLLVCIKTKLNLGGNYFK